MEERIETDLADRLLSKIKANRPIDKSWKCNHDNEGRDNKQENIDLDYSKGIWFSYRA